MLRISTKVGRRTYLVKMHMSAKIDAFTTVIAGGMLANVKKMRRDLILAASSVTLRFLKTIMKTILCGRYL